MKESVIHTIKIVGGTWKGMHNTQARIQNNSNLTEICLAYIDEKWDQNVKGNNNNPQDKENPPQMSQFLIIRSINSSTVAWKEPSEVYFCCSVLPYNLNGSNKIGNFLFQNYFKTEDIVDLTNPL